MDFKKPQVNIQRQKSLMSLVAFVGFFTKLAWLILCCRPEIAWVRINNNYIEIKFT